MEDILLIEGNDSDATLINMAFEYIDVKVKILRVTDGKIAFDYLYGNENHSCRHLNALPKLIISEINLPLMNGFDILEKIKSEPTTQKIPFAFFSVHTMDSYVKKSNKMGADYFLNKPLNFNDLVYILKGLVSKSFSQNVA